MANEKALWIRRPGENEPYHRLRLHTVCPPSRHIDRAAFAERTAHGRRYAVRREFCR